MRLTRLQDVGCRGATVHETGVMIVKRFKSQNGWVLGLCMMVAGCSGVAGGGHLFGADQEEKARSERLESVYAMVADQLLLQQVRPASSPMTRQDSRGLSRRLKYALFLITAEPESSSTDLNLGQLFAAAVPLGWPAAPQLSEFFLQRVVSQHPKDARAYHLLGILHLLTGDQNGALALLETALAMDVEESEPRIQLGLGQVYYLQGQQEAAVLWLGRYLERVPEDQLVRAFLTTARLGFGDEPLQFRLPHDFVQAPFRPAETLAALNFPRIEYRNVKHGFSMSFPYTWTLYDEEVDYPLARCRPMAELTLDLPLKETEAGELISDRVRVLSFPVPKSMTSESFSQQRLPIYEYPTDLEPVVPAVLTNSVHVRYVEVNLEGSLREGEMVFYAHDGVAYFIHFMSTPDSFDDSHDGFRKMLKSFRQLSAPPFSGCDKHPI